MNVKAIIPHGQTVMTVNGLHQWDYGQKLEIHSDDLPAMIEVHFACLGMDEAIVRSCSKIDGRGVFEAAIPDRCLEQSAPITAWVCEVGATSGTTVKTLTLVVTPRVRPQRPESSVLEAVSDKYTEAVAAMNSLVDQAERTVTNAADEVYERVAADVQGGTIIAPQAEHAKTAELADKATVLKQNWSSLYNGYDTPTSNGAILDSIRLQHMELYAFSILDVNTDSNGTVMLAYHALNRSFSSETRLLVGTDRGERNIYMYLEYDGINLYTRAFDATTGDAITDDFSVVVQYQQIA